MDAPIKIPNFEMDRELGRGGMSRVFLAQQLEPKRKIAVKIVSPGSSTDAAFLKSLKQEGDLIASLSHDNIITIFVCGIIDDHFYMAMEVLAGGDLSKRIEKGICPEDALEVMLQIGSALEHAHKKGIVHRDIKPENVMFHENGKAVLVDFGIAKEQDTASSFTQMGVVVGTPHYMSPERCMGKPTDHRSDLYAMGAMFFEMLTGHKVYEGSNTFAVSYAHVHEPVPPLPPELSKYQGIVSKLLAKDPDNRFQNSKEMLDALKKLRAGSAERISDVRDPNRDLVATEAAQQSIAASNTPTTVPSALSPVPAPRPLSRRKSERELLHECIDKAFASEVDLKFWCSTHFPEVFRNFRETDRRLHIIPELIGYAFARAKTKFLWQLLEERNSDSENTGEIGQ